MQKVLVALGALALGLAPTSEAAQSWQLEDAVVTLSFSEETLNSFGFATIEERVTERAGVVAETLFEGDLKAFAARPAAADPFRFETQHGHFVAFEQDVRLDVDGGLAFKTFHPGTGAVSAPLYLFDFVVGIDASADRHAIWIETRTGDVRVPFEVRDAGFTFDAEGGRLGARMGDVLISAELARAIGQPNLAGQWLGVIDIQMNAFTNDPADAPMPEETPGRGGSGQTAGINVVLGQLYGLDSLGHIGTFPNGQAGLSAATTSCNGGDQTVPWNRAMEETHPFIQLAMFRLEDGVLEMLGKNYLKHGWFALSSNQCNFGCSPSDGTYLGIGCSDTYGVFNNGNRSDLGPRHEVDPYTASWTACGSYFDDGPNPPDPDCDRDYFGSEPNSVVHRLEVWDEDLNRPNATFYYEGAYIVADETTHDDNIGWRECDVEWSGGNWDIDDATGGLTPTYGPLINTWGDERTTVSVSPDDGTVILAVDVEDNGDGTWHYEYALYNWRSNRGVRSFSVPVGGANLTNIDFRDIDKTAGNDWTATVAGGMLTWSTDDFATDPDANALHYQTLFNFRFDADQAPVTADAEGEAFEPGTGGAFTMSTQAPSSGPTDVPVLAAQGGIDLRSNEPNPFADGTRLSFSVPARQQARVAVFDVTGREIRVLLDGVVAAGDTELAWDGRDAAGERVASGVYFFRLQAAGQERTVKGTLLR